MQLKRTVPLLFAFTFEKKTMDILALLWIRVVVLVVLSWNMMVVLPVEGNDNDGDNNNNNNNDNDNGGGRKPYESLSDLERRWYISRPIFSYHGYEVKLQYNISSSINPNALDFRIYDGVECRRGSDEIEDYNNGYLVSSFDMIEASSTSSSSSSSINTKTKEDEVEEEVVVQKEPQQTTNIFLHSTPFQQLEATFRIDTDKIRFTSLYQDYGDFQQINFCVKVGALHEEVGWNETVEVNWVETPVLLRLKPLSFEVAASESSSPSSPFDMAYSSYETRSIEIEQCDTDSKVINASDTTTQSKGEGKSVHLCVHAASTTLSEGGNLLYVENFSYQRHNHTQLAIKPHTGGEAAPASAPLQCDVDSNVCSFDTYLGPEFFSSAGVINGYGTAMLQFGNIKDPTEGAAVAAGEKERNDCCRIVPVRFDLKMVALPAKDDETITELSDKTFFSRKTILLALLCIAFILWCIMHIMCRCTTACTTI